MSVKLAATGYMNLKLVIRVRNHRSCLYFNAPVAYECQTQVRPGKKCSALQLSTNLLNQPVNNLLRAA